MYSAWLILLGSRRFLRPSPRYIDRPVWHRPPLHPFSGRCARWSYESGPSQMHCAYSAWQVRLTGMNRLAPLFWLAVSLHLACGGSTDALSPEPVPCDPPPINTPPAPPPAPVIVIVACAPSVCGDGIITTGCETCDDANVLSGDGCSENCTIEPGWKCVGAPSLCTEAK